MFGIDLRKIPSTEEATVDAVDEKGMVDFKEVVDGYKLFDNLMTIIKLIVNHEEYGLKSISDVVEAVSQDMTDEEYEEVVELIFNLLEYLKVSKSAINDLIDDDEDISSEELVSLVELIVDRMGDADLYEFVAYAIHNPDLVEDTLDSIEDGATLDWAFFESSSKCKNNKPSGLGCYGGYHYKDGKVKKGFWRYSKLFKKRGGGVSANNYKEKKGMPIKEPKKKWSYETRNKWIKTMRKRKGEDFGKRERVQKVMELL